MNRIISLLLLMVLSGTVFAQSPSTTKIRYPGVWLTSMDTATNVAGDSTSIKAQYKDSSLYFKFRGPYRKLAYVNDITAVTYWTKVQYHSQNVSLLTPSDSVTVGKFYASSASISGAVIIGGGLDMGGSSLSNAATLTALHINATIDASIVSLRLNASLAGSILKADYPPVGGFATVIAATPGVDYGTGSVKTMAISNVNGYSGTVAGGGTENLTVILATTVTGIIKGLSGALTTATPGIDYALPGGAGSFLGFSTTISIGGVQVSFTYVAGRAQATVDATVLTPTSVAASGNITATGLTINGNSQFSGTTNTTGRATAGEFSGKNEYISEVAQLNGNRSQAWDKNNISSSITGGLTIGDGSTIGWAIKAGGSGSIAGTSFSKGVGTLVIGAEGGGGAAEKIVLYSAGLRTSGSALAAWDVAGPRMYSYVPLSLSGALTFAATGTFAAATVYRDATLGLVNAGSTGSTHDYYIVGPGGADILKVPTGTVNLVAASLATGAASLPVQCNSTGLLFFTPSMAKFKHNFSPLSLGLSDLRKIKFVDFDWIDSVKNDFGVERQHGVTYEQVIQANPAFGVYISTKKFGTANWDNIYRAGMKAIQTLADTSDDHEQRIQDLEMKLANQTSVNISLQNQIDELKKLIVK